MPDFTDNKLWKYSATVKEVIDGDTILAVIEIDLGFHSKHRFEQKFRLANLDAPETSTEEGKSVKAWMIQQIEGKQITLESRKQDKYGRWLATIYLDKDCINDTLIRLGMAKPYSGGKR